MINNRLSIFDLPGGVITKICRDQPSKESSDLSDEYLINSIKVLFKGYNSNLKLSFRLKTMRGMKNALVYRLHQHIVLGRQAEAEKIIKEFPRLLLETSGIVADHYRKFKGRTALQLALSCLDLAICEENKNNHPEMADMILSYLLKLENGKQIAWEQFQQQFPNDEYKNTEVSEEFKNIVQAIIVEVENKETFTCVAEIYIDNETGYETQKAIVNDESETAFNNLRIYLARKGKITQGLCFNMHEFLYLLNQYHAKFLDWSEDKRIAFSSKGIGSAQCPFTICTAQMMCLGLYVYGGQKKPLERSLACRNGTPFFSSRLGVDFYMRSLYGKADHGYGYEAGNEVIKERLEDLYREKIAAVEKIKGDLIPSNHPEAKSEEVKKPCVIF